MGWWSVSNGSKVTTGDTVLDLTRNFLRSLSQEYQQDLHRKPTLAELEYTLNLAFRVNLDDEILDGFEELELKQVLLRTAKRPKRVKPKPGDVFAFKIENNDLFGFGRLISTLRMGMVAEIFDYFSPQPVLDQSKKGVWLFSPVIINQHILFEAKLQGDWRIIERSHHFEIDRKFDDFLFVYGEPPNGLKAVDVNNIERAISKEQATRHRAYSALNDTHVQKLISESLKGRKQI